ncbi:exported protein family 3 Plasmodium exported, putative [Plasmodium gaboni]|uniref:Exported protein family 3 Plasmodium exported, putative n=1 Tax=Plasmodium gaboni TaxID=647221 RepID=A0ABY1UV42_9APIC|nr:exported protein family 3 Plasmodium exported, putative [Plasmodium gaboni]
MKYFVSLFNVSIYFLLIYKYSYTIIIKNRIQDKFNKSIIQDYIISRTLIENNKNSSKKYIYTSIFSENKNPQKREKKLKAKKYEEEKQNDNTKEYNDNNIENENQDHTDNPIDNLIDDPIDDHIDDPMDDKWEYHNSLEDNIKEYYSLTDPSVDEENKSFFKKLKLIMNILDDMHSDLLLNNNVTDGSILSPEFVPTGVLSTMTVACPPIVTVTLPYITSRINFLNKYEGENNYAEHETKLFK